MQIQIDYHFSQAVLELFSAPGSLGIASNDLRLPIVGDPSLKKYVQQLFRRYVGRLFEALDLPDSGNRYTGVFIHRDENAGFLVAVVIRMFPFA